MLIKCARCLICAKRAKCVGRYANGKKKTTTCGWVCK